MSFRFYSYVNRLRMEAEEEQTEIGMNVEYFIIFLLLLYCLLGASVRCTTEHTPRWFVCFGISMPGAVRSLFVWPPQSTAIDTIAIWNAYISSVLKPGIEWPSLYVVRYVVDELFHRMSLTGNL